MKPIDKVREVAEDLDWFDWFLILAALLIIIGEWQGWWNDTGVIALNTVILAGVLRLDRRLTRMDEVLRRIEEHTDRIERNTRD